MTAPSAEFGARIERGNLVLRASDDSPAVDLGITVWSSPRIVGEYTLADGRRAVPVFQLPGTNSIQTRDAVVARMLDRVFDNYVSTPVQKCVFDALRAEVGSETGQPDVDDPQGLLQNGG